MKYIIAIVQPHKLEEVKKALEEEDIHLMTVSTVLGQGRQKGRTQIYRGAKEIGGLLKKVKFEIAVNEDFVERTIETITRVAKTGQIGDGKIFVFDLNEVVRVGSGERGSTAIN